MHLVQRNWIISSPCSEKKKTGTKNGKTGASERKQSAHIKSRPISLSQQYSGFKKILKKIIIKDMNVKGKCDKTQQVWF